MKRDWDIVTSYIDHVGTSNKTVLFPKTQESVKVTNKGNTNLIYTIGTKSGTLTPNASVTVNENLTNFSLRAATGKAEYEVRASEAGTEKEDPTSTLPADVAGKLDELSSSVAQKAAKADLDTTKVHLDTLDTRMNTVVAAGATVDNAETVDGRVGSTGTVFNSLGHNIRSLENGLKKSIREGMYEVDAGKWEIGTIDPNNGTNLASTIRIRSGFVFIPQGEVLKIVANAGYKVAVRYYDINKVFVKSTEYRTGTKSYTSYPYVRFIISDVADGNANIDYAKQVTIMYTFKPNYLYDGYSQVEIGTIEQGTFTNVNVNMDVGYDQALRSSKLVKFGAGKRVKVELSDGWRYAVSGADSENPTVLNEFMPTLVSEPEFLSPNEYLRFKFGYFPNGVRQTILTPNEFNDSVKFKIAIIQELSSQIEQPSENSSYLSGNFSSYYASPNYEDVTVSDALKATTIANVYNAYDTELGKYPNIMTKRLLGYGGDANNVADTNLPIYEYTIKALTGNGVVDAPTILLTTGVHGEEKSSVWSTLQFVKQLLNSWQTNTSLESILSNVNLKIIPVVNPSGYNTNTRENLRGVDLNRNFSYKWQEYVDDGLNEFPSYKGTAMYSERETQIVRDWLIENKNAISYWDFHNLISNVVYTATPNANMKNIFSSKLRVMSNHWNVRYGVLEAGKTQGYVTDYELPMAWREGIVQGIKQSALVEVGRNFNSVEYSKEVIERGVDLISNYILGVLDFYSKGSY